jgi:predicted MarR family transcription regulator
MPPHGFRRIEIVRRYYPLDILLDAPRVRVLRAIRHFDQATVAEIAIALDGHDFRLPPVIENLLRAGELEQTRKAGNATAYRITAKGRRALRDLLQRGELDIKPEAQP